VTVDLATVAPRASGVFRVARRSGGVFVPTPWKYASPDDGTFGGRFDDPGLQEGLRQEERFRVIYCATEKRAAFVECLAAFRRPVRFLAELAGIMTEGEDESIANSLAGTFDPAEPVRGLVPLEWRMQRQIGHTYLDPSLQLVDISDIASLNHLRQVLAGVAFRLGLDDIDLSAITSRHRTLTQACARYIYEQIDESGRARFAGIRYLSHLSGNEDDECWAVFSERIRHTGESVETLIHPDDPALLNAAAQLSLTIEGLNGLYLRP
jgi:hypothetical protein